MIDNIMLYKAKTRYMGKIQWVVGYLFKIKGYTLNITEEGVWADGYGGVQGSYEIFEDTLCKCSGIKDKYGYLIFEGDMFSLVTADGETITITCRYGTIQRQIYENLVEITGFYFERSNDGRKTFPIVNNYLGKHDIELWERIGNIYDEAHVYE